MVTLLEALTRENVPINSSAVPYGTNTVIDLHVEVENWQPWVGFDYSTLTAIFKKELDKEYTWSQGQEPLPKDVAIHNEESLEDVLRRFISPTVNYALHGHHCSCHFGRGSRCKDDDRFIPDWSVVSDDILDTSRTYANILPGDTKLSAKWSPELLFQNYVEWQKVLQQIVTYMASNFSRYGFIITDTCLVALRITRCNVVPEISANFARRSNTTYESSHQRQISDISMSSQGSSLYADVDAIDWQYLDPEYALIPWNAYGPGQLTVKLALWCLAMMSANGGNSIEYWYPGLDTWRPEGKYVVNYASGMRRSTLPKGHKLDQSSGTSRSTAREGNTPIYGDEPGESSGIQFTGSGEGRSMPDAESRLEDDQDEFDDDENETVVDVSTKRKRVKKVRIERHFISRNLYFRDARGRDCETSKDKWRKVKGGYELETSKYIYFTDNFP